MTINEKDKIYEKINIYFLCICIVLGAKLQKILIHYLRKNTAIPDFMRFICLHTKTKSNVSRSEYMAWCAQAADRLAIGWLQHACADGRSIQSVYILEWGEVGWAAVSFELHETRSQVIAVSKQV